MHEGLTPAWLPLGPVVMRRSELSCYSMGHPRLVEISNDEHNLTKPTCAGWNHPLTVF